MPVPHAAVLYIPHLSHHDARVFSLITCKWFLGPEHDAATPLGPLFHYTTGSINPVGRGGRNSTRFTGKRYLAELLHDVCEKCPGDCHLHLVLK